MNYWVIFDRCIFYILWPVQWHAEVKVSDIKTLKYDTFLREIFVDNYIKNIKRGYFGAYISRVTDSCPTNSYVGAI